MAKIVKRHWLATLLICLVLCGGVGLLIGVQEWSTHRASADVAKGDEALAAAGKQRREASLRAKLLDPTVNAQVKSVVDAAKSGKNPERQSALFAPPKFDAAAYAKDRHAYLDVVEPGRVWDTADGLTPGVKEIEPKTSGGRYQELAPLGTVLYTVVAEPGAPVTFTSFGLGCFQNKLQSITLEADGKGEATAQFTATEGTVGLVSILAASPKCIGQVELVANVVTPQP